MTLAVDFGRKATEHKKSLYSGDTVHAVVVRFHDPWVCTIFTKTSRQMLVLICVTSKVV